MRTWGAILCYLVIAITTDAHAACTITLTSASGRPVTIAVGQVVGIVDCQECGGATATIVNTLAPTYWVRESAAEVSKRLDAALKEGCPIK